MPSGRNAGPTEVRPDTIRTPRLLLLPLAVGHADVMADVLSDPALHRFTGGVPESPAALRDRYERWTAGSPDPAQSWCNWVVQLGDEGPLTGTVQATVTGDRTGRTAEIAWTVGTPWQGRGIATEAAQGLVAWLREHDVRTVIAHIHPDHAASAAVAAAAGLSPTTRWHDGEVRWESATG